MWGADDAGEDPAEAGGDAPDAARGDDEDDDDEDDEDDDDDDDIKKRSTVCSQRQLETNLWQTAPGHRLTV